MARESQADRRDVTISHESGRIDVLVFQKKEEVHSSANYQSKYEGKNFA